MSSLFAPVLNYNKKAPFFGAFQLFLEILLTDFGPVPFER